MVGALENKRWINKGRSFLPFEYLTRLEAKYNAVYVADFPYNSDDSDSNLYALFWQPVPPTAEYNHHFAINLASNGIYYISSGAEFSKRRWTGYVAESGEVIYTIHKNFYRESADGTAFTDGKKSCGIPVNLAVHEHDVVFA